MLLLWLSTLLGVVRATGCSYSNFNPVSLRIGNVTLANGQTARGAALFLGTPKQPFAFMPQWPLNNILVYGANSGFCSLAQTPGGSTTWTNTACTTFRGGLYDAFASTTRTTADPEFHPVDSAPFPQMSYAADTLKTENNASVADVPIGVALSSWNEQGYHPMAALGLGANSTVLNKLFYGGNISSRTWGMFWGRNGGTPSAQLDGSLVLGGYDRAKVSGQKFVQSLAPPTSACPTGMLVAISDMVLNFPNGSTASLFPKSLSTAMSACIWPDLPSLMAMPVDPYFNNFLNLTQTMPFDISMGQNWFSMRFTQNSPIYRGDLTIKLQSGLSIRIPNDQLVVPDTYIDVTTGSMIANNTDPDLVIHSNKDASVDDLPWLGRQFLSAAYVMANLDSGQFTLWEASPTEEEDIIAVDMDGQDITCYETNGTGFTEYYRDPLSAGAIAGIVIGSVVFVALLILAAFWLGRRRRANIPKQAKKTEETMPTGQAEGHYNPGLYKAELQGIQAPIELNTQQVEPSSRGTHELLG